jgi:SAM-dependent methyltransferase
MLPIPKIVWFEATSKSRPARQPEPDEAMDDPEQVRSYVQAYEWGGPTSALQLHHLHELSTRIRPGDTVLDLACGPGPLLLELAPIYPDVQFIGADLSAPMLGYLEREAEARELHNITTLREDIRTLPGLSEGAADLVISTSALHHVPDEESLRQVFLRIRSLLKPGGGFYLFDFAQLKSSEARNLCVAEVAKLAPPLTARDFDLSLKAAFPFDLVLDLAQKELPRPFIAAASALMDFFYFLQTPARAARTDRARERIAELWPKLQAGMKIEHLMLRRLRRTRAFR